MPFLKLKELIRYTDACPTQWVAKVGDNRPVYIRYRFGQLTIHIGKPGEAVDDIDTFAQKPVYPFESNDGWDGYMTDEEMLKHWKKYSETPQPRA